MHLQGPGCKEQLSLTYLGIRSVKPTFNYTCIPHLASTALKVTVEGGWSHLSASPLTHPTTPHWRGVDQCLLCIIYRTPPTWVQTPSITASVSQITEPTMPPHRPPSPPSLSPPPICEIIMPYLTETSLHHFYAILRGKHIMMFHSDGCNEKHLF